MRKLLASGLGLLLAFGVFAQTPRPQQQQTGEDEEIIRITTALVQLDAVVVDKNDRPVTDLKLSDFEVYENGKRQQLQFLEFVGAETGRRTEGSAEIAAKLAPNIAPSIDAAVTRDLGVKEVKRVLAFVVDDLTIPFEDMATVRQLLLDFVNDQMREGDLVAIVRSIGGKALFQQFTNDKQLLRRAIAQLNVATNPFSAFNNPPAERRGARPQMVVPSEEGGEAPAAEETLDVYGTANFNDPNDETQRLFRSLLSLNTAGFVIDSMREIPGRKSLVLLTGGIPIFEASSTGSAYSNVTYMLNQLTNRAVRAGVAINTMDPRGLKASPGVAKFTETPGRSALSAPDATFGRGGSSAGRADIVYGGDLPLAGDDPFGPLLAGGAEHLGLSTVANATGGVAVVNTNNFREGLDKVLAHSAGYYILAYTPADKFDNKFRRVQIKVKREGVKVYTHHGYLARAERAPGAPRTKEESIMAAAKSPLARRDLDVAANVILKPSPANKNAVEVHMLIDPKKLSFKQNAEGKYQTTFDVVGFVHDQLGRLRGGFSETVAPSLSPDSYRQALATGLTYSATTQLPAGYYQLRAAVREEGTGSLGTVSRYVEVPDLSNGRLAMSSLFLFAADPAKGAQAAPTPLLALRQVSRKQDLRYAAQVFNAKTSGGKHQLRSQVIISQGGRILYREPEQPVQSGGTSPVTKIGQIGLSGVSPGRYVLTLLVTDALADKKAQAVARSIDFTVVE